MSDSVLTALIAALGAIVSATITACAPIIRKIIREIIKTRNIRRGIENGETGVKIPPKESTPKSVTTKWPEIIIVAMASAVIVWLITITMILPIIRPPNCSYHTYNGQGGIETIQFTQCRAAKIRIELKKRALVNYGYSLWEVEAYESTCSSRAGADNLVLGGSTTASSVEHGAVALYKPNNVIDGYMNTRWSSEFSDPQVLEIDLPDSQVGKPINCIVLNWESAFAVEYDVTIVPSK